MPKVVDSWPSDSPGYTHYVLARPYTGKIVAQVTGLTYGYTSEEKKRNADGSETNEPVFVRGDPVTEVYAMMNEQRDFEFADTVTLITFDDGTTYTPGSEV